MFIFYFYITAVSLENMANFIEASGGTLVGSVAQVKIGRKNVFVQAISIQLAVSQRAQVVASLINIRQKLNLTDKDVGIVNEKV